MNRHHRRAGRPLRLTETFTGHMVQVVKFESYDGADAAVVLGVGPAHEYPMAYLRMCPCVGVDGLVADLQLAAAEARPLHEGRHAA
jgi:hypothetical protein